MEYILPFCPPIILLSEVEGSSDIVEGSLEDPEGIGAESRILAEIYENNSC